MLNDNLYSKIMSGLVSKNENLQMDLLAKHFGDNIFDSYINSNYDSSADYWKLVKQENGKCGLEYDGFHSLYDESGNLLIRNEMDEFDADGNNLGAWALKNRDYTSFKSYAASLGMLLGTYTNYMDDKDAYELNWSKNGNNDLRETTERLLREIYGTSNLTFIKDSNNVIDVNPFLMTLIGIKTGVGTQTTYIPQIDSIFQTVNISNEYNNVVGQATSFTSLTDKFTNMTSIENMIPEGRRLKAGTIKFEHGDISIYGLSTTMPDPTKMSKEDPAIADGTYAYSYSLHNPGGDNPYFAMRLYDSTPFSWNEVIGPKGKVEVQGFPYSTGEWGKRQNNFPAFYYEDGIRKETITNLINGHNSNYHPYQG